MPVVFRDRARAKRRSEELDRPLRLVTVPGAIALTAAIVLIVGGGLWLFLGHVAVKATATGVLVNPPGNAVIQAPLSGTLAGALAPVGERVVAGAVVARIRLADGSLDEVHAPITGTVIGQSSGSFEYVERGDTLLTIAPATAPMAALLFVPATSVSALAPGMPAEVAPTTADITSTGVLLGAVSEIGPLPVTRPKLALIVGDDGLVDRILANGPVHEVIVEFQRDPDGSLGLRWSGAGLPAGASITSGTVAFGQFILREQTPWQALIGDDGEPTVTDVPVVPAPEPTAAQSLPVTGSLTIGSQVIGLEVARTPRELETGLMFRTELPPDRGMAFVFDEPAALSFWMKDTLIPLDIVYVLDGVVSSIVADAPPCEEDPCPIYPSDGRADTVIELAAGRAAELGIVPGTRLDLQLDAPGDSP